MSTPETTTTKPFYIRLNTALSLAGQHTPEARFPACQYIATPATNQPDWKAKGLVFISNRHDWSVLVGKEDYRAI